MKKYTLLLLFIFIVFASQRVLAQKTFNSKKKNISAVNVSSLQAKQIRYAGTQKQNRMTTQAPILFSTKQNLQIGNLHKITGLQKNQLPSFIETKRRHTSARLSTQFDVKTNCYNYLTELHSLLKVENAEKDFVINSIQTDATSKTHIRLQQQFKGIPIYGAEVAVHLNSNGEGEAFNGKYFNLSNDITIIPTLTTTQAIDRVKTHQAQGAFIRELSSLEKQLVQEAEPKTTLCIYESKGLISISSLVYHVVYCPSMYARWEYFVDAHTGAILNRFNTICSADGAKTASANDLNGVSHTVNTYLKGSTYYMIDASRPMYSAGSSTLPDNPVGGIMTIDLNNTFGANQAFKHVTSSNNTWTNATAVSAHFNAGTAYEYYRTKHSRNSIDGNGGTIISIINTTDENGQPLDNAFWNGKAMFYGNGNVSFKKLAGGLDVAGHEMTHGVVQNTANLEYQGESGAINESMADIFGTMLDPTDWTIGEDVVKASAFPSGALRSLSDPHNGGASLNDPGYQPSQVNEMYTGTQDNGGVHVNSGIPNHAFYLFAQAITRDKAIAVFYKTLNEYLTKSSQFIDLRLAVIKAAGDLYGVSSAEVTQAGIAFDAVGIGTGQGGSYTETLPANPGTEYLLVNNTDTTDPNTLYLSNNGVTTPLSKTVMNNKPSVTDDGSGAVFVAGDHTIHVIVTDPDATQGEFVLQSDAIWSNAVISKGGNRLAAVTTAKDKKIHVYDFTTKVWSSFELYNPTFSEGVVSGGPLYSDALEWDYSGEYLVYDAFNSITNSAGSNIEYWDVNFIHVWDKATSDFSDGKIEKLFSSLPDGVSIGNPSFAKNTPNVIAFDYIDETTNEYAVLGMNIETNDINVIVSNNQLGWPSYNKTDSRIAFTQDNGAGNTQTSYVTLNSDKISSNQQVTGIFDGTSWPVYFSVGNRGVGTDEVTGILDDKKQVSLSCFPNPFSDEILLQLSRDFSQHSHVKIVNLMGEKVADFQSERSEEDLLSLKVDNLPTGQYIVHIQNARTSGTCKVIKIK